MASTLETKSNLLRELAEFFATAPNSEEILSFKPSEATVKRANELLELNRNGELDRSAAKELEQFDHAETLMRLVKATIRANQVD